MRVALISLGCAKNLVDGETMLGLLATAGHELAASPELADAVIVNTCGFIVSAQRESVETLLEVASLKTAGRLRYIVAAGCLAQRNPDELLAEIPELDAVVGTGGVAQIGEVLTSLAAQSTESPHLPVAVTGPPGYLPQGVLPRLLTTPPWTAYIKISEGCDNRCSYCVIPGLRGDHRSRPAHDLLDEVQQLAASGVKEIVLVGQDLTRWGHDLSGHGQGKSLPQLLTELSEIRGIEWLRLHYLHPARVDRALLTAIADLPKVCRYLDVPAQHGDDAILASMGRGTTAAAMLAMAQTARELMPQVAIRTSLIVGFPGETPVAFARAMRFLRELAPDWTAVFGYSRERGTPAAELPEQVAAATKAQRRARMLAAARRLSLRRNQALIGQQLRVLVETPPSDRSWPDNSLIACISGRSEREAPQVDGQVHVAVPPSVVGDPPKPGEFAEILVTGATAYDVYGEIPGVKIGAGNGGKPESQPLPPTHF